MDKFLIILAKFGMVLTAFCAPFLYLIHSIIFLVFVDLLTAIMKDVKNKNVKGFVKTLKVIQSGKLRKSGIKLFLYILFILSSYILMMGTFGQTFFIMQFVFASFAIVEITSIGANISDITGNDVFTKVVKKMISFITEKISKTID